MDMFHCKVCETVVKESVMKESGQRRRTFYAYLAIFILALAVRVGYLGELRDSVLFSVLLGDGRQYNAWATEIAAGDWLGQEVFYQAPLYPYFMAVVLSIFGPGVWPLRIIQILLGATSCVFVAMAGHRFFSLRTALVAGALLALYPPAIFFDGLVQKASLGLFLTTALVVLLGELALRPRWWWLLVSGAVLGCLALTRENALLLAPLVFVWLLLWFPDLSWGERTLRVALFSLGLASILIPVGVRNLAVGGRFLVTTSQWGPNFFIGNNPEANGRYVPLRRGRQDARVEREDATLLAEAATGRKLDPSEVSSYWLRRSFSYIAANPGHWLRLLAKKAHLTISAREIIDTESIEVFREHSRLLAVLGWLWHFGVLGPLAILGIWATRGHGHRLAILYAIALAVALSLVLFYVLARYRFPLVPVLVLFAAAGLVELVDRVKSRSFPPLIPGLVLLVMAAIVANWPLGDEISPRATTYYNLGVTLFEQGDDAGALIYLEKALAIVPDFAEGHFHLGKVFAAQGNVPEALRHYASAVALRPDHAEAHFHLGYLLIGQGRLDEAAHHLQQSFTLDPDQAMAHNLLGNVLAHQGNIAEAVKQYEAALSIDPGLADAHFKLGMILREQGNLDSARRHLEEVVRLLPDFAEARRQLAIISER